MKKGWGILAKRILVVGLTVSLVGGTIDVSALTVSAQTTQGEAVQVEQEEKGQTVQDENVQTMQGEAMRGTQETTVQTEQGEAQQGKSAQATMVTVTGFAALSDNITEQKLPVGAEESDICLPETLTVTVEKTVTGESDEEKQDDQDADDVAEDGKKQETGTGTGDGKKPEVGTGNGKEDQPEAGTDDGNAGQPEAGVDNGNAGQSESGAGNGNADQPEAGTDGGNAGQSEAGADNGNAGQSESGADTETGKPQSAAEDTQSAVGIVGRLTDWFFAPMTVHAAEDNGGSNENAETESEEMTEQVRLAGITWEIDAQESDAPEFDGSKDGFCYVYQPVLPDTDGNGNSLTLADGVELPAIYVLVGEYGIATLEDEGVVEVTINNGAGVCYATLKEALEVVQEYVKNGKGPNYTLKFLKDITEEQVKQQELYLRDSADLLTIDLNGCEVGYKEGDIWQTDVKDFGIKFTGDGRIQLIDSSAGQKGYFHGVLQVGGGVFTINAGTYEDIELYGIVMAHLDGGACKGSISVGASDTESNSRSVFCEMTQGTYNRVDVYQDAQLKVRDDVEIAVLRAHHTAEEKAEVVLFGGYYGEIETIIPDGMEDSLEDSHKGFAIEDMLEDGFAFYNGKGELQEIERTTTTATDVSVQQATVDSENAAVRIDVVKESGGQESFYYATWAQVTKALSGDSDKKDQFGNWAFVKVVLLKNVKARGEAAEWSVDSNVPRNITVCSEEGNHYTLTGASGNNVLLDVSGWGNSMVNLTLENIRIDGGCILARETNLTLEKGVAVSSEANGHIRSTIRMDGGELVLNDAQVSSTTEGSYAVDLYESTLRMKGIDTKLTSVYIAEGNREVTAVIDAFAAEDGTKLPSFTAQSDKSKLKIIYTGIFARFGNALDSYAGKFEVWYQITLRDGATLVEGNENDGVVTSFENNTYGLYWKDGDEKPGGHVIYVGDNACQYTTHPHQSSGSHGGTYVFGKNPFFLMPESAVEIAVHNWQKDGSCKNLSCNRIDIEKAYAGKALTIEGLEGRTYDSYPQILSKITWASETGETKELTAPTYDANTGCGTLGFGGDTPRYNNADYTVVYRNNVESYSLKPGDAGFDATKAPQVTITGKGNYAGSLTIYFTIGAGEMRLGDFDVCGAKNAVIIFDGMEHKAWNAYAVEFKVDEGDKGQFSQLGDAQYIQTCNTTEAVNWFGQSWSDPNKVEYSTDDKKTWIVEKEFGAAGDKEKMYMITDAGEYPFYIKVTNKSCGELVSDKLTAKITPRDLTDNAISFSDSSSVVVYYTGKEMIPGNWDRAIVDTERESEPGTNGYVLNRDKDFTVSCTNHTDVTKGGKAKVIFTGIGNYTGELSSSFAIQYAFTLKQTTKSKAANMWYSRNTCDASWQNGVPVIFRADDVESDSVESSYIVCYDSKEADADLNGKVEFYTSLEDAIAGTNPGYTFQEEGRHTVTLWGKDLASGYISAPIEVTLNIDTTAPIWADKDGVEDGYGVQIKDNWWRTLLNTISFGRLYNDTTLDIKIHANDAKEGVDKVSGVSGYYYYIDQVTDIASTTGKTKAELDTLASQGKFTRVDAGNWLSDSATIHDALSKDGNYVVYAYAVDGAGNQSDYICTDGLVKDAQAPVVTVTEPKKEDGTLKDTQAMLKVHLDEDATLMWFFVSEGEFKEGANYTYEDCKKDIAKYMDSDPKYQPFAVQKDGKWEAGTDWYLDESNGFYYTVRWIRENKNSALQAGPDTFPAIFKIEGTKGDNILEISDFGKPLYYYAPHPNKKCMVWIAAIDKAGNITVPIQPFEFTMTKAMPRITTLPQVSGTYGDKTADLKVTQEGVAEYDGNTITGTWSVSGKTGDTHIWQIRDAEKCLVTFTPDAAIYGDTYEAAVVEVTPTIAARPVTIRVENMHKIYGEPYPGIENLNFEIVGGETALADGDTKETFRKELNLWIDHGAIATDTPAGKWMFWIEEESVSGKYKVAVEEYYDNLQDLTTGNGKDVRGWFIIQQAQGELVKEDGYQDEWNVTYGDTPFSLAVKSNNVYRIPKYTVTEAKDANGTKIAESDIAAKLLAISRDGEVTIKGAGSAKIVISLPEGPNHTAAANDLTVTVNIKKKITGWTLTSRSYLAIKGGADRIDLTAFLPADCGAVSYGTVSVTGGAADTIFEKEPSVIGGELSYQVKPGKVGNMAEIRIPVTTDNYADGVIRVSINLVEQKPVRLQGKVTLKKDTLTYGEALSGLTFNNVTFVGPDNEKVDGTIAFQVPDAKPDAGTYRAAWIFTPADDEYASYSDRVTVTVNKAKPQLANTPVPGDCVYNPCLALYELLINEGAKKYGAVTGVDGNFISGEWKFADETVIRTNMKVGSKNYAIYFKPNPEDEKNYDFTGIKANVTITVKKAIPYISVQPMAAGAYTHGDYLYNQQLNGTALCGNGMGGPGAGGTETEQPVSGTFTWKNPSTKLSYRESNGKTYEYVFTPDDTTSFETVTGSVTVTVNKAEYPPRNPAGINGVIYAAHSCEKVGNVELPQDWVWDETDAEKPLVEGQATEDVYAEYTGADKDNYEKTRVSISIVRSSCEHARTEVQNVVKATCSRKGNSGKVYCLDCKQYIKSGYLTAKDATNHTALTETVIRQATTARTGLKARECKDCGYYAEVTIPKLSGGNTGGSNSDPGQQPEPTGSSNGKDNQNPSGGNGGGSSNGGQSTVNTPGNTKPQTTTQQPATGKDSTKPGNTEQNQTNRTGQGDQNRDTKEPYIKGENGKEGWDSIHDEVTEAKEGETVSVHMNGATTVPGDVLSQISGKDITLVLDMGNGITWSINGKNFTKEAIGDINFGVTYGEEAGRNIPMDVINNVTGERYSMNLTLAYDGEFGFGAVLSINMDSKNEGLYANLFYYNPESGEMEFICAGQIGEDGNAELDFTHASDYTIVIDTQPMDGAGDEDTIEDTEETETAAEPARETDEAGTAEPEKDDAGVTGWIMLIVVILAAAAGAGAVTLQKRKKQQEKE